MSRAPDHATHAPPLPTPGGLLARELHLTLALLSRERDETEGLMDAITEGILQLGPGGVIVRANHAARAFLGLPAEPEGLPLDELIHDEELLACIREPAPGAVAVPRQVEVEGRRLLVRTRALPERLGIGAVVVLLDLTDLQRFEGLRRDFVASASHELKTPLTSIRGYAELLLDQDPPAEVRRTFLERIARNAARLETLVEDLLDLSRLDAGGWRPRLEMVDIREAAREAWSAFEEDARRKRIHFALPPRTAHARADHAGLVRVFSNLFSNAIRFTPEEGRISVRLRRGPDGSRHAVPHRNRLPPPTGPTASTTDQDWIAIEVTDTGTGIPAEALPRIFERFYRVDPARARRDGGTGLGLSIVKHLIERMDGTVGVTSEPGKGTTIHIRLPAEPTPPPSPRTRRTSR